MQEFVQSLGINWAVMLAQVVNFTILLLVLGKFVYQPVMKLLDDRRRAVEEAARRQKEIADEFTRIDTERDKIVAEGRAASADIIKEAERAAEELRKKLLLAAQEEAARLTLDAEKRMEQERARLLSDVKKELGSLVVGAIERGFGDALDGRSQGKMVEQALAVLRESEEGKTKSPHTKKQ